MVLRPVLKSTILPPSPNGGGNDDGTRGRSLGFYGYFDNTVDGYVLSPVREFHEDGVIRYVRLWERTKGTWAKFRVWHVGGFLGECGHGGRGSFDKDLVTRGERRAMSNAFAVIALLLCLSLVDVSRCHGSEGY